VKEKFRHAADWISKSIMSERPVLNVIGVSDQPVAIYAALPNGQSLIVYPDGTWDLTEYKGR
jgi:hypothetical protein